MKKINTLVVGQGIAGSLVAYMLHRQNISFAVIDPASPTTASRIAAGMFTPISGKRKTIHPMVDQQLHFAINIYEKIGELLGTNILHQQNIHLVYNSLAEQNEIEEKSGDAVFAKYIRTSTVPLANIIQPIGAAEINHSGWVDCELMINRFTRWLKEQGAFTEAEFLYADLQLGNEDMKYQGMEFRNIIFCEGYRAMNNPFFPKENIIPCKGDILTILYDHPGINRIVKKNGIYVISTGNNRFRAGSTYLWNNNNEETDDACKTIIEDQLDEMLEDKYSTIDHRSAIRATTPNRDPIAKKHLQYPGMFMLNGLGTKGILQGPWWAREVVKLILNANETLQE